MGTTDRNVLRARHQARTAQAGIAKAITAAAHAENDLRDTQATIQDMSQNFKENQHGKSDEKKPAWVTASSKKPTNSGLGSTNRA